MENFGKNGSGDLPGNPELSRWLLALRHHDSDAALQLANDLAASGPAADPVLWYTALTGLRHLTGFKALGPLLHRPPSLATLPKRWRASALALQRAWQYSRDHPLALQGGSAFRLHPAGTLVAVIAAVNGIEGVLVFDTGASSTLLSESFASRCGVPFDTQSQSQGLAAGGSLLGMYPGIAATLTIDGVTVTGAPLLVSNLSASLQLDGILSPLDLFRGYEVRIHMGKLQCEVRPPAQSPASLSCGAPLLWEDGNPLVAVTVDQRYPAHLLVDTGAGAHLLCRSFAESVLHWTAHAVAHSTTASTPAAVFAGGTAAFRVGSDAEDCHVTLAQDCFPDPDALLPPLANGYLGLPWFRRRQVVFPAARTGMTWAPDTD